MSVVGACVGWMALATGLSPAPGFAATLSIAVQGNHFINGSGQTIRLLGVDRAGSEYMCTGGGGQTFDGPVDDASISTIASWHTNAVRVPLNEDCWLGINGLPNGQTAASYQSAIVAFVNRLHAHGQYAILDLHWNNGGTALANGQQGMADADHAPAFWTSVANTFKADPAVVFDLYNEPHDVTWDCWKNGGCADPVGGFTVAGMQSLITAVRNTGAAQPIMVGGLGWAGDVSQWLSFKPTDPGNALVASFHTYNFSGCDVTCWNANVKPIAASYPVVTGELGENDCLHGYIDSYMTWADVNGVSYLGWAWNPYSCGSFPSLITDYNGTPTGFGIGFRDHLTALAGTPPPPLSAASSASATTGLVPLAVNFTGSATGGMPPYTYAWNFGDGGTSSTQSPSHTYGAAGAYLAVLTVTDSTGANASATAISINATAPVGGNLDHVVIIMMENTPYGGIIGNSAAPYLNSLASQYGLATNYFAITHPSLPNYLSVTGGSTFGITSDCTTCFVNAANIVDRVEGAGRSWKAYMEDYPGSCFLGDSYPYVQKHNPFIYYDDIRTNAARCNRIVPYTNLATDLASASTTPNYVWITPNMCNDMHDCATATGDSWLQAQVPTILSSPAFTTQKSVLVVVWDEDDLSGTNQVAAILAGPQVKTGYQSTISYNHYSLLKTVEWAWGLSTLTTNDGSATAMTDFLGGSPAPLSASASASPTSGSAPLSVNFSGSATGGTGPYAYAWNFGDGSAASTSQNPSHTFASAGMYTAKLTVTDSASHTATASAPAVTVTAPPPLTVSATANPMQGDAPVSIGFMGAASGGTAPYAYAWVFGDGGTGAGANPSHIYNAAGTYTATVTVTDATAVKASGSVTVVVSPTLSLSAAASPLVVDQTDNVSFTSSPSGGLAPYGFSWSFGDGSAAATSQNPIHAYSAVGTYNATVTLTDANGVKATASVLVNVHALPSVTVAASPAAGDAPLAVGLTSSPSGGTTPYSFSWDFGDASALSTSQNPNHIYSSAGSYSATVTLTDSLGHSVKASATVVVAPTLGATANASPTSGMAPMTVNLTGSPTGGKTPYSYSWDFGDGSAASSSQNPSHVYASAGTYTAKLTVTDANGVTVTASAPAVTVTPAPLAAIAAANPAKGDAPLTTTLTATATGGTAPYTYTWDLGDGTTSILPTLSHSYGAGSFTAAVTIKDSTGQSAPASVHITVYPSLSVTSSVTPTVGTASLQVAFSAAATGGLPPYSFTWDFGDGTSGSGSSTSHSYSAGTFYPKLTVHDSVGGVWTGIVAAVASTAPVGNPGGGGNGGSGGGGGNGGTASQPAPATPNTSATPSPEASPTAEASPKASGAPETHGSPSGGSGSAALLVTLLGGVLATGIGGFLFSLWRRGRLG